jgi:hypothetical protein
VQRNNGREKGTEIVPFKGTVDAQKEQQLFCSKEKQACKKECQLLYSKEQKTCKRNTNCSIQRNNKRVKRNNNCFVQRNSRHAKGTTIVPFKGTVGTQKEQQLFHSKEQQAHKRNNNC